MILFNLLTIAPLFILNDSMFLAKNCQKNFEINWISRPDHELRFACPDKYALPQALRRWEMARYGSGYRVFVAVVGFPNMHCLVW
jgi:hypothetical protein